MNAGVAALLGAVVGGIFTAVVPWIREIVTEKSRAKAHRREQLSGAISALIEACVNRVSKEAASEPVHLAAANLNLLIEPADRDAVKMVDEATTHIGVVDSSEKEKYDAYIAYILMAELLPDWFRGDLSASELLSSFRDRFKEWSKQEDDDRAAKAAEDAEDAEASDPV